jgi:hypothetical protein
MKQLWPWRHYSIVLSHTAAEIFTGNPTQDSFFGVVSFVSVISSPKQATLVLALFFYQAYFPSYRNYLHLESNPGQLFGLLFLVFVISFRIKQFCS